MTRPFRRLCPEADLRDSMDDAEFWDHVFNRGAVEPDWDGIGTYEEPEPEIPEPCAVCGSTGACAYDPDGRPMIHATEGLS